MEEKQDYSLKLKMLDGPTPTGLAIERCLQDVMKANNYDHPIEAIQYVIEHLVAAAVFIGVPSLAVIEGCFAAALAGEGAAENGAREEILEKLRGKSLDKVPASHKGH